ncbi:Rieske (2Fe-2S) protein [Billgrantia montanilacus]|uniref:Rieske (2Fe-2S) protein n=1 Tax=Billgrantia montanilacus TaxID=2282305 RepID=A0A368U5R6_9GAMM|nr:Rieske 2Fe-2S domain-containing protein [Halomonas montanilacus]RCV90383.1 Rieske (2Fe-2S) protein [Halomonas montanilacus]
MSRLRLAHQSELDTTSALGIRLPDGREALLVKVHGRISAFVNRCPHQGVTLHAEPNVFLEAGGELIQCAMHGALFLPETGECVFGPCQGRHLEPVGVSVDAEGNIQLAGE